MPTFLTAFGETKLLLEWAKDPRCCVSLATLHNRILGDWDPEEALTTPSKSPADRWKTPINAFGESKPLLEWERDPRAKALATAILKRLRQGWSPEEAISVPEPEPPPPKVVRPQPLYYGKTISELVNDPRCKVSRYTLERNLRARMPLEEALVFRKRERFSPDPSDDIQSVAQALDLLKGGELWQYLGGAEPRYSILRDGERFALPKPIFKKMLAEKLVRPVSNGDSIRQYALT